ncbi:integrase core domain-containing protein, partial [Halotalea alkalilenta]
MCHRHRIEHRLIQAYHPWTNGQVERMNRTL